MRDDLPRGTVTFLFTDVAGSTRLLRELGAAAYAKQLADHRAVIRGAAADGVGVLLISEDLDEILALADRVAVMYEGRVVGEVDAGTATVEEIGLLMAGGAR